MNTATRVQIMDDAVCILHSAYNFGNGMHSNILPTAFFKIVSPQPAYKDGIGIKWPTKIDIPCNKETKTKFSYGQIVGQTALFNLGMAIRKLWIRTC